MSPRPRLLVVDDDLVMRTIAVSLLSQHEFDVQSAPSADEALARILAGQVPDLVLLDVLMPGMDGFEACRRLRAEQRFEHLPIIMLTALDDQDSIDEAYRCGATDFITKPLNSALLPHRVRYLLRAAHVLGELIVSQQNLIYTQHLALLGNWTMDQSGAVIAGSNQYIEIIGGQATFPVAEETLFRRVHREDLGALQRARQELRQGKSYQLDYRLVLDKTLCIHAHEVGFPRYDDDGRVLDYIGFTQDISRRIEQEEKMRYLAWHDCLTGLSNRNRLIEILSGELAGNQSRPSTIAVLFIHLDGLRRISSVFGQPLADAAVKVMAGRLRGVVNNLPHAAHQLTASPAPLNHLARYDEDSFVIVTSDTTGADAIKELARRLIQLVGQPLILQGEELLLTAYIGAAFYPEDADDALQLLRRAMLVALQAAKTETSGCIAFFDPDRDRAAAQRLVMERDLRIALERGEQLLPYFQPKISAITGDVVGAEVLLRWRHPRLGLVAPAQFIPLAEETGLIHPISIWLIEHVCELIALWHEQGLAVGEISINLSADSFFDRNLCTRVDNILRRTGVAGSDLIIELTESVLMRDGDTASRVIAGLAARGLRISLDDFGTGYSSLGYLNRFAIDEIKVDRSFVTGLESDERNQALVGAIIKLGHALGLKVVAEGIENTAQAHHLRRMGCDVFQGFLFAKPMPAEEFAGFHLPHTIAAKACFPRSV